MLKRVLIITIICVCFFQFSFNVTASDMEIVCTAKNYAVFEADTKTMLLSSDCNEKKSISHLTKLMTILLCAQSVENETLSARDIVVVTPTANSMQGTQIWLEIGERITVEELLYAVTVGNANDAAVALAEKVGETHEGFVEMMNLKAYELGMFDTKFVDASGISEENVSTAYDIGLLCCELVKYDFLKQYFTTWMINVRNSKTELVNSNRLVRSYNGITGLKACYSEKSGHCITISAKRGDMYLIGVFIDCADNDTKFSDAKSVLDKCFSQFTIYIPEISEYLTDIIVESGRNSKVQVNLTKPLKAIVLKGELKNIQTSCQRKDTIRAPFAQNTEIGTIDLLLNGETIAHSDIITANGCKKKDVIFSLKKLLCRLLIY